MGTDGWLAPSMSRWRRVGTSPPMSMSRRSVLLLSGATALLGQGCETLADADATLWGSAAQFDILLAPMSIAPRQIVLRRGVPVRLHIVNVDRQARGFYAGGFFANVATRPGEALFVSAGGIELPPCATRSIVLVPLQAGQWPVDSLSEMPPGTGGTITVLAPTG